MSIAAISLLVIVFLSLSYHGYGTFIAKEFKLSDNVQTPAHQLADGVDYVPTSKFSLFAQHFSAIAAAGPIAGPIVACQNFGWLPCLLWISLGVVFIGAVHDFSSLVVSVKHGAKSIADVTKERLGSKAGRLMMIFIWLSLIYIIVAFTDITAGSFITGTEELQSLPSSSSSSSSSLSFHPGGAVAAAALLYLILSVGLGLFQRFTSISHHLLLFIFVPLSFLTSWCGLYLSHYFIFDIKVWYFLILLYCLVGSLTPVWLLLQPRGVMGGFILYSSIALGLFGIFFGGYAIEQPMFKGFNLGGATGQLFPFLFVTIACGACSGFHGLVCSGTTSKQLDKESHAHSIGYGAMLAEGIVAVIALSVVMMMDPEKIQGLKPGTIYGQGLGQFLTLIIGKEHLPFAITFGAMAFSTFIFDTLDVSTRLGRYLLEELFSIQSAQGKLAVTFMTLLIPGIILLMGSGEGSWVNFWTLFGSANQLLAALSLMVITYWLYENKKNFWITLLPLAFVFTLTIWSLIKLTYFNITQTLDSGVMGVPLFNALCSMILILLGFYLMFLILQKVRKNIYRAHS